MLDYKDIIIKHFGLEMSGSAIASQIGASKSGVNDLLRAFKKCDKLSYPLPEGITNYGIAELVYGRIPGGTGPNLSIEQPDFEEVAKMMTGRKNMTLVFLWNRYKTKCSQEGKKFYSYRQFCENYSRWCDENYETFHFNAVIGEKMEVDFAGQTFVMMDPLTGEHKTIVVFAAVLPYSQYIYAEGMLSTKEPQWIDVNNNALSFFGGVPTLVVCDNCKQAVLANKDWIEPVLNKDYAEWAEHNHTVILPAKVRRPKYKSSVENAIGIMEKGFFHDLEERKYFSLEQFNKDLWEKLEELNRRPFEKKEHNRLYYWEEERHELMPLPSMQYRYMERRTAKVSSDYHIRFDNAYYSVDKAFLHKKVEVRASSTVVRIYSQQGEFLYEWKRAVRKGQWSTDPKHLPDGYKDYTEWNGAYFLKKASAVGPNTEAVINRVLGSRSYEVQTYRMCLGILGFQKKYDAKTLEALYRSPDFLNKDRLTLIADLIGPEYEEKISKRINNRLRAANLQGSPEDINLCLDTTERRYLPNGIIQVLSSMDFVDEGFNLCILGASDAGKSYLAKALGIKACNDYRVGYYHCEELLEEMSALKLKDYDKFRSRLKSMTNLDLVILDDFLLHTITEEREIKVLFDLMEKRNEKKKSTIICSQRDPDNWAPMIMNDVISANSILKRATKHYTVIIEHTDKN